MKRPRVFCASLADWLDDEVPVEWLADLLDLIRSTPHLDWLLLTKRPENWKTRVFAASLYLAGYRDGQTSENPTAPQSPAWEWVYDWISTATHPANVWIGWSVENQPAADKRTPHGLAIPARVHFVSCEPLLGAVELSPLIDGVRGPVSWLETGCADARIDWVIAGGESGPKARPMHPDWARSLRDQCKAAGVAFHFKQWGEWVDCESGPEDDAAYDGKAERWAYPDGSVHAVGGAVDFFSVTPMYRVGKLAAGRLLDGVEHNAVPEGAR